MDFISILTSECHPCFIKFNLKDFQFDASCSEESNYGPWYSGVCGKSEIKNSFDQINFINIYEFFFIAIQINY